jgi:hypothetical protein
MKFTKSQLKEILDLGYTQGNVTGAHFGDVHAYTFEIQKKTRHHIVTLVIQATSSKPIYAIRRAQLQALGGTYPNNVWVRYDTNFNNHATHCYSFVGVIDLLKQVKGMKVSAAKVKRDIASLDMIDR